MGKLYFILFWGCSMSEWFSTKHVFDIISYPLIAHKSITGIERAPVIHWFPWIHFLLSFDAPFGLDPPFLISNYGIEWGNWHWMGVGMRQKNATSTLTWVHECRWLLCLKWCICVTMNFFPHWKFVKFSMREKATLNFVNTVVMCCGAC